MQTQTSSSSFFGKIRKQYIKEHMAFQNLILSRIGQPSLVFLPFFTFVFVYFVAPYLRIERSNNLNVEDLSSTLLQNPISYATFLMMLLITYYGAFRLQQIQGNGQYGYWLALGIERSVFFRYVIMSLTFNAFFGISLAMVILILFTSVSLSFPVLLLFFVTQFVTSFIIVSTTIFISELVGNSELTLMINGILFSLFLFFIEQDNFLRKIFYSNLYYTDSVILLYSLIALVAGSGFFYLSYLIHKGKDIELGG